MDKRLNSLFALLAMLAAGPVALGAEPTTIYRCETPQGTVFSEEPCGGDAQQIKLEEDSAGIAGGPPEHVREQLAEQREARAREWQAQQEALARAPQPAPPPQVITIERPVFYPDYWWQSQRPPYQRPPHQRPPHQRPPHQRPPPQRPVVPPRPPGSGTVLKPLP